MWTLVRFASHTLTVCDVFNLNLPILPAERKPILDLGPPPPGGLLSRSRDTQSGQQPICEWTAIVAGRERRCAERREQGPGRRRRRRRQTSEAEESDEGARR